MARQVSNQVENNFINGLITEANVLNFPEKSCTSTDNCVFHLKGDVTRRLGVDFEPGYGTKSFTRGGVVVSTYLWQNAAGQADKNFLVVQIGGNIYFYAVTETGEISQGAYASSIDFSLFATSTAAQCASVECQFTSGKGYLFGANPHSDPFYISYNPSTDSFSSSVIQLTVRDTKGLPSGSQGVYNTRVEDPDTLTDTQLYNLYNQGWAPTATVDYLNTWRGSGGNEMPGHTGTARTDWPSDADVWWLYKASDGVTFNRAYADTNSRGNTPAPKGYYIYNAFEMNRGANTGVSSIPVESSGDVRPKAIAFYAGRVWYAGVDAQGYATTIYFSQLIKDTYNFGFCYQLNDPTNEYLFDLLATDGGTVEVLDMGSVVKLFPLQTALLVFATNGVWSISGNQGIGFTAGDYSIRKVSSIPSVSPTSFVDVEGMPVWWNNDGIYMVTSANAVGTVQIESLTEKTIKTFYNEDIPVDSKRYARGAYNPLTRQIQWLFRSYSASTVTERYEFNKVLNFNVLTKAFYPWTFPNQGVKVNGVGAFKTLATYKTNVASIDSSGAPVLDEHSEPVISREDTTALSASVFKYFVTYPDAGTYKGTWAEMYDDDYVDFASYDNVGVDYVSYLTTGYRLDGKAQQKFQPNYVFVYFRNRDEAALDVQGIWQSSTSVTSGYYGQKQRITSIPTAKRDFDNRKIKCRGNGKILQLKFSSVSGLPFELAGWSIFETVNSSI